jgi:quercetin dioxygenase-like cupin family protein
MAEIFDSVEQANKQPKQDPEIKKLIDLVDYQDGSVVSKQIIKRKAGTVTIFAFDDGEGLSEHTAPFDALVQVLDGEVRIKISGKPYDVKAGEMIILPVDEPHSLKALTKFKMLLTMIRSRE